MKNWKAVYFERHHLWVKHLDWRKLRSTNNDEYVYYDLLVIAFVAYCIGEYHRITLRLVDLFRFFLNMGFSFPFGLKFRCATCNLFYYFSCLITASAIIIVVFGHFIKLCLGEMSLVLKLSDILTTKAQLSFKLIFWLSYVGMVVIAPGVVHYQKKWRVGNYCGGIMHKNLSFQMFEKNWRKLHGDTLDKDCKFIFCWNHLFMCYVHLSQLGFSPASFSAYKKKCTNAFWIILCVCI